MTKKIDFTKLMLKDVEGHEVPADISKDLGNVMYMRGMHIEEKDLGHDIYHHGEVELDEKQQQMVQRFIIGYPIVIREAVLKALE